MTQKTVNYAEVLYQLGVKPEIVTETKELFQENPALYDSLTSPVIDKRVKMDIVDKVFSEEIRNYLKVLVREDGMKFIDEICDYYFVCKNNAESILKATLYYVDPPTDAQKKRMEDFLKKEYNMDRVELSLVLKKELIGGFLLEVGNKEYDWSILGRYNTLKQTLVMR